ncbi:hypothetical protein B0T19DRAFT_381350 [Cercophora scortea]|uniref:Glucose-methanol-choline oxidoreductase N-terminal domain-containing protein n=1 Tax=Cercophora scortea TaxID=314031 RepID=A0AAE0MIB8_9PEZI|nr:hypothetical protein B0T19DRAFT_381350 [Cercophora scortea]
MRVSFLAPLALSVACSLTGKTAATSAFNNEARSDGTTTYDYIIVGAGVSGLVVANRLTEDSRTSVLVIERGDFDNKPEAIVPWYGNLLDTSVLMNPTSAPNAKLNNATTSIAVPAVVGGGSVVNGMGYIRGSKADYDSWEALGNPGWGWSGLLPYFRKGTTFTPPSPAAASEWNITWDSSAYGNGPLHVSIPDFQYPDIATIWDALRHQNVPVPLGSNNGGGPGAVWTPSTIDARTKTRSTSRSAYYDPVNATRPNLKLLTGQTAAEILFHKGHPLTTAGVRIVSRVDNTTRNVYARKEVILAAGAVQTPQLLQVSGIGPASVLQAAGIPVKKDMPAVGANYQDHATAILIFSLANPSFPNPNTIFTNATYNASVWDEYLANKTGPIAAASATTVLLFSRPQLDTSPLLPNDTAPHTESLPPIYSTSPSLLAGYQAQLSLLRARLLSNASSITAHALLGSGFTPAILFQPLSRGTVTLNLTHPHSLPVVSLNTFSHPLDAANMIAIVRRARRFWASPELAPLGPTEVQPGAQWQTDEEILEALTTNPNALWGSLAHPSGTCAMMPERLGGCVAPDLRVYGVRGLSVVDASVLPLIPGAALQATVYAVAEKAADLIKARG